MNNIILVAGLLLLVGLVVTAQYASAQGQGQGNSANAPGQVKKAGTGKPTPTGVGSQKKCNNVKLMAVVVGLDTSKTNGLVTLQGQATLQGQTVMKTITVNTTDTTEDDGVGLPLFFKKAFTPCPSLGTPYSGSINGTTFSGALTSISKPNLAEVDLGGFVTGSSQPMSLGS